MSTKPKNKKNVNDDDKYAPTVWAENTGHEDVTVPSGQLVLARRTSIQALIQFGLLQDLDLLSSVVVTDHLDPKAGEGDQDKIMDLLKDPKKSESLFHMLDKVLCFVVVKPEIKMPPNDVTKREDGVIYADTVDLADKMFLFEYATGGTNDVSRFREGSGAPVGDVEHS